MKLKIIFLSLDVLWSLTLRSPYDEFFKWTTLPPPLSLLILYIVGVQVMILGAHLLVLPVPFPVTLHSPSTAISTLVNCAGRE